MGEIADMMLERYGEDHDSMAQRKPEDYLSLSDEDLRKGTAGSRNEKIKGIRTWPMPLSKKQRYCLAAWLAEKDNRYA